MAGLVSPREGGGSSCPFSTTNLPPSSRIGGDTGRGGGGGGREGGRVGGEAGGRTGGFRLMFVLCFFALLFGVWSCRL